MIIGYCRKDKPQVPYVTKLKRRFLVHKFKIQYILNKYPSITSNILQRVSTTTILTYTTN